MDVVTMILTVVTTEPEGKRPIWRLGIDIRIMLGEV
jgi:hypothetical protein